MKKSLFTFAIASLFIFNTAFESASDKWVSKTGHVSFFSHTEVEDIVANNYKAISTIEPESGNVVFSVPMQAFEFEKSLMQKHFNSSKFLDTKEFPKTKFKGVITNLSEIDFTKDGTYDSTVEGELTLHGVTKPVKEMGSITVKGKTIIINAKMNILLADYKVAFEKGKPSTNIAKTVEVTIIAEHQISQ